MAMLSKLPARVKLVEVGPRDGLQNEQQTIAAEIKIALVDRLTAAGFVNIEAASFVSPKWVPQMATSAEVMEKIARRPGTMYSALTPNMQGFERGHGRHQPQAGRDLLGPGAEHEGLRSSS